MQNKKVLPSTGDDTHYACYYCFLFFFQLEEDLLMFIRFEDTVTGNVLLPVYDEEEQKYYLFLPSCTSPEEVTVQFLLRGGTIEVLPDGKKLENNLSLTPLGQDIIITASFLFYRQSVVFHILQCGSVPTIFIEAPSDILSYLHEDKSNSLSVKTAFYDPAGEKILDCVAEMKGRGNSTWADPQKKPYNLKYSSPVSIGPFQNVSKLCLLAEYYDRSKLRNAMVYHTGNLLEIPYTPGYMHCDLFVNGEYRGIYGISTKEDYLKYLDTDDIKAVFTVTGSGEFNFYPKLWASPIQILYGDEEAAWEIISRFTKALECQNWEECSKWLDMHSFAHKYVLEELFANTDMGYSSQYFYIDKNDVIHCMMPWDYDLSIGNTFYYYNNKALQDIRAYIIRPNWYERLLEYTTFRQLCLDVLENDITESVIYDLKCYTQIAGCEIADSWNCDLIRWDAPRFYGDEAVESLTNLEYPNHFIQFIKDRVLFLKEFFEHRENYRIVSFEGLCAFCIPEGETLAPYMEGASVLGCYLNPGAWKTENGRGIDDIGVVNEDIVFLIPEYFVEEGE